MSDAAPLPRLGEVFFDVRGNSRSMRLSWYADTGVAVFSIWQAGMCTGTFRLPIGDLSRMIEILERGPSGRGRAPVSAPRRGPGPQPGGYLPAEDEIGLLDAESVPGGPAGYAGAGYAPDYGTSGRGAGQYGPGGFDGPVSAPGDRGPGGRSASHGYEPGGTADYPAADYGTAGYGETYPPDGYQPDGYPPDGYQPDGYPPGGYQPADRGAGGPDEGHSASSFDYQADGYGRGGYADDNPPRRGHPDADHATASYPAAAPDYATGSYPAEAPDYLTGEHQAAGYHDGTRARGGPDYLSGSHGGEPDFPPRGRRRDESRFPPNTGGFPSAETDGTGYHEERFVPPYVQGGDESYRNDKHSRPAHHDGDLDDVGYPGDAPPVSPSDDYQEPRWPDEAYSHGPEYRHR